MRGRLPSDLKIFDPIVDDLGDFVPKKLTRRIITSKVMARYDPCGKLAPLTMIFKAHLRLLIRASPDWDAPVTDEMRAQWLTNFTLMNDTRDFWFGRSVVPIDAVDCRKMRIWILNDAAKGGIMIGAWAGYLRKDGSYSCAHLLGRGLLSSESLTIPKLELHSLNVAANISTLLSTAMAEWLDIMYVGGDSEISLSWVMYETNKLDTFTRNRVINIRGKIPLSNLHHVEGKENLSDLGTRPENVFAKDVHPQSEYATRKDWMKLTYVEALKTSKVRKISDIRLDHESKKKLKEGLVLDKEYEREVKGFLIRASLSEPAKIVECEKESGYIYPPLKYAFRRMVRTTACVLLAVKKWKLLLLKKKSESGIDTKEDIGNLRDPTVKFRYFCLNEDNVTKLRKSFNVLGFVTQPEANNDLGTAKKRYFSLADVDLSYALEYLYKIGTKEVLRYLEKRKLEEISVMSEGILYYKSRILDGETIKAVGGLEEIINYHWLQLQGPHPSQTFTPRLERSHSSPLQCSQT